MNPCPHCRGLGRLRNGHRCFLCNATGYIKDTPLTDTKKLTMIQKKQSPLQGAIIEITNRGSFLIHDEGYYRCKKEVIKTLQALIEKEQQTFSEIFEAGYNRRDFEQKSFVEHQPDKTEFLNQFKP